MKTLISGLMAASLCAFSAHAEEADPNRLDWLTGCWLSQDGMTREVWSVSEDGYYFGYSVVLKDRHLIFFEQMRIDPAPLPVFNAYPGGEGPSAFPATELTETGIVFANPAHDFPQKIQYRRDDDTLRAVISAIDDSSPAHFHFEPCPGD